MTPVQFCYWLQGLFELGKPETLTEEQVKIIQTHLAMVDVMAAPATPAGVIRRSFDVNNRLDSGSGDLIKC